MSSSKPATGGGRIQARLARGLGLDAAAVGVVAMIPVSQVMVGDGGQRGVLEVVKSGMLTQGDKVKRGPTRRRPDELVWHTACSPDECPGCLNRVHPARGAVALTKVADAVMEAVRG